MAKRPPRSRGLVIDKPERNGEPTEQEKAAKRYHDWLEEIEAAKKVFRDYHKRCRGIVKTYKDERQNLELDGERKGSHRLNILWSNVQTLQPALYSRTPQPNCSRRFLDRDPISRIAALIAERNLITAVDLCDFDYPMKRARDDYLLVARGTAWVRYTPEIGMAPVRHPATKITLQGTDRTIFKPYQGGEELSPDEVKEDEEGPYFERDEERILTHGLSVDHVLWSDFLHEPVDDWTKVGWAAKRVLMKRRQLVKHFGDLGKKVSLNKTLGGNAADEYSSDDRKKADCAEVWEIVSKDEKKVIWLSDGLKDQILKEIDDPLGIATFWPFPRPLFGTLSTDSLIPVPDYALYQDQAEQLDKLTDRIRILIQALRVVGLYNSESADLQNLLSEGDENEMIPVESWVAFVQGGGMKGNLDWLPMEMISNVLQGLFNARAQIKQDLYEITGISDIIRGATAPQETATAQQIKANFGNLRLTDRQAEMSRFARDTLRIMAEVQCEHYPAEVLIEMSGVREMDEFRIDPTWPPEKQQAKAKENEQKLSQAIELLKSDRLRSFRIDMETDATVAPDQQKEKETRVEFLTAVAPFLEKAAAVGAQAPQLVPLLMKMLEFGVRGFRAGRTLEAAIEETISLAEQMQQQAQNAPEGEQPPADPAAEAMAAKLQAETQKIQQELARLTAQIEADKAANERKRLEDEERRHQAREKYAKDMLKLTEDIAFRRSENEKRLAEIDASIRLKEMQIQQQQNNDGLKELQGMLPKEIVPEDQQMEQAASKTKLAQSMSEVADLRMQVAELKSRLASLDTIEKALASEPTGNTNETQDVA